MTKKAEIATITTRHNDTMPIAILFIEAHSFEKYNICQSDITKTGKFSSSIPIYHILLAYARIFDIFLLLYVLIISVPLTLTKLKFN